jgi:hypothetical protein
MRTAFLIVGGFLVAASVEQPRRLDCTWVNWKQKMICADGTSPNEHRDKKNVTHGEPGSISLLPGPFEGDTLPTLKPKDVIVNCNVVKDDVIQKEGCANIQRGFDHVRACSPSTCAHRAFEELNRFVARTAFLGSVLCHVESIESSNSANTLNGPRCTCFFSGLGRCRNRKQSSVTAIGDSTMR